MYEPFFRLSSRPFAAAHRVDRYFPSPSMDAAREATSRCIDRAAGVALTIGPAGCGKSFLCEVLARHYADSFRVIRLGGSRIDTAQAFYQTVLYELDRPYQGVGESEGRISVRDIISADPDISRGVVLLVDEAHDVPEALFDELTFLSELQKLDQTLVRIALFGTATTEDLLAQPRLQSFNQRIAARSYLGPFDSLATASFVRAQLAASGADADEIFAPDALEQIHRVTEGVPRLVIQACVHVLLLACAGGTSRVTASGIDEAWADLQQLPLPRSVESSYGGEASSGVIEFADLDDDSPLELEFGDESASIETQLEAEHSDASELHPTTDVPDAIPDAPDVANTIVLGESEDAEVEDSTDLANEPTAPADATADFAQTLEIGELDATGFENGNDEPAVPNAIPAFDDETAGATLLIETPEAQNERTEVPTDEVIETSDASESSGFAVTAESFEAVKLPEVPFTFRPPERSGSSAFDEEEIVQDRDFAETGFGGIGSIEVASTEGLQFLKELDALERPAVEHIEADPWPRPAEEPVAPGAAPSGEGVQDRTTPATEAPAPLATEIEPIDASDVVSELETTLDYLGDASFTAEVIDTSDYAAPPIVTDSDWPPPEFDLASFEVAQGDAPASDISHYDPVENELAASDAATADVPIEPDLVSPSTPVDDSTRDWEAPAPLPTQPTEGPWQAPAASAAETLPPQPAVPIGGPTTPPQTPPAAEKPSARKRNYGRLFTNLKQR